METMLPRPRFGWPTSDSRIACDCRQHFSAHWIDPRPGFKAASAVHVPEFSRNSTSWKVPRLRQYGFTARLSERAAKGTTVDAQDRARSLAADQRFSSRS